MFKLKCIDFPWDKYELTTGAYRLGRAKDNEIVLEDASVAAHQCEIVVTGSTITLRDLSSEHETYVDEQRVEYTRIQVGQTLRLGTLRMRLEGDDPVAAAAAPTTSHVQAQKTAEPIHWGRYIKTAALTLLLLAGLAAITTLIFTRWSSGGNRSRPAPGAQAGNKSRAEPASNDADEEAAPPAKRATAPPPAPKQVFNPRETNRPPIVDINAADIEMRRGDFVLAEPFLHRALQNQRKILGPENPEVTKTLHSLGRVHRALGQFKEAEPIMQEALKNVQKARPPEHPETATALNNLGELYLANGQLAKAAPLLNRAAQIRERTLSPDDPDLGESLNNLAALNSAQGNPAKARPLLERSLKILDQNQSSNDPNLAQSLNNLADLHQALGEPAKAEPLLQRALKMKERALRTNDSSIAVTLNSLAALHAAKGDYPKAEPLAQRALQIAENAFGPEHPNTVTGLDNLASIDQKMGNTAKAAPLYQRAAKIAEKTLGPEHPKTALNLSKLAEIFACPENQTNGPPLAKQALSAKLKLLTALVWYASEEQRLAYRNYANPYTLAASVRDAPELMLGLLRYKGVIIESLLEDRSLARAKLSPDDRVLLDKRRAAREGLAQLAFETPKDSDQKTQENRQADMQTLAAYLTMLEDGLDRTASGAGRAVRSLNTAVGKVKLAIPDHGVLLEMVRYSRCVGNGQWETGYGAMVLTPIEGPTLVPLANADEIEKNVAAYQAFLQESEANSANGAVTAAEPSSGQPAAAAPAASNERDQSLSVLLRALYQQLWAPIERFLPPETKIVIISPDAALNFVPFAALLNSADEFIAQKHSLRYVSSGRDLLGEKKAPGKGGLLILGNPTFSAQSLVGAPGSETNSAATPNVDRPELQTLRLPALASSTQEVARLETQAQSWGWPVRVAVGAEASESQLASANSPRILHLATCGFCLSDSTENAGIEERPNAAQIEPFERVSYVTTPETGSLLPESAKLFAGAKPLKNPIQRSGVALAGAQATLAAWTQGDAPPPGNDGIVTAEELGALKLEGTDLVVLSACDPGIEPVRSSDAILALRRAFIQAGAQHLLIRLRPSMDVETVKLMDEFYERYHRNNNAPQAFAENQRDWLVRLRRDHGLAAAVSVAAPFVLSSRGPAQ